MNSMDVVSIAAKLASAEKVGLTVEKEGGYGTADGQIISILTDILHCKYAIENAYRSFEHRVKGPWLDSLVEHWQDHAKEERQAAYDIAMKIMGLGADAMVSMVSIPKCPGNLDAFLMILGRMELDLILKERELIECAGDNTAMKVLGENLVLVDTQHLDDLRRMGGLMVG